jgi:protein TonB
VKVGGNVQSAKLIKHPTPLYPAIAKSARIQGTVVLQAIIGKDGTVQNLKMVSTASPLLVQAAMDAVKQWVYQPTLLNSEPVDVITEITVNFTLQ